MIYLSILFSLSLSYSNRDLFSIPHPLFLFVVNHVKPELKKKKKKRPEHEKTSSLFHKPNQIPLCVRFPIEIENGLKMFTRK